ncbi:hypothetical protein ACFLZ7_00115 [Nanoarchaeota archaeon]
MTDKPVFIKIDKFENVVAAVEVIRKKINEAKTTLTKLSELKSQEDGELDKWSAELGDVENKIDVVETMLSEGM